MEVLRFRNEGINLKSYKLAVRASIIGLCLGTVQETHLSEENGYEFACQRKMGQKIYRVINNSSMHCRFFLKICMDPSRASRKELVLVIKVENTLQNGRPQVAVHR